MSIKDLARTIAGPRTEIQPGDIDLSDNLCNTFGKAEIETAAENLIRFLQERGRGWEPFFLSGLHNFYINHGLNPDEMLFGLFGPWFDDGPCVVRDSLPHLVRRGNKMAITEFFVNRVSKHVRKKVLA